jgi:hypothetical protein
MTQYAHITESTQRSLQAQWTDPATGNTIMGLSLLSDAELAALGWYPVRREPLEPGASGYGEMTLIDGEYVIPSLPADLEAYRAQKQQARVQAVISARQAGFQFAGHVVASDTDSWLLIQGAVTMAQLALAAGTQQALDDFALTLGAGWRAIDQTVVAADAAGVIAMGMALAGHMAYCDGVSQAHKAAIDAAETIEALEVIDPTAGYPA